MLVETLAGTRVLETWEDAYPAGLLTEQSLLDEHRERWANTPKEHHEALHARRRALQAGLDLLPDGWRAHRVYPEAWDLAVGYRVLAPDGGMRASAWVAVRQQFAGERLGVRAMAPHRDVLQGPAALAAAAALALAAAHV